jgi:hypothetical protein
MNEMFDLTLVHVIEVVRDLVNHHVKNIVIVHVVHVTAMNIDVVKTMIANIVVNIDDGKKTVFRDLWIDK